MRKIFLVRHGIRKLTHPGKDQHDSVVDNDPPLSRMGQFQAARTGEWLANKQITAIYCSPYTRTVQTAIGINSRLNCAIFLMPEFCEWLNPEWFPRQPTFPEWTEEFCRLNKIVGHNTGKRFPSYPEVTPEHCYTRSMNAFFELMAQTTGNLVVVGHGAPLFGIVAGILGAEQAQRFDYCMIVELQEQDPGWTVGFTGIQHLTSLQEHTQPPHISLNVNASSSGMPPQGTARKGVNAQSQMFALPFFTELATTERILLAGAGGGFDIFCGLPLYFSLRAQGKTVYLANLSFSFLRPLHEFRLAPTLIQVTADTPLTADYFPERYLSQWFREHEGEETSVYCFERTGVQPLLNNYQLLVERLSVDTIILVDGGTDSLMRGDEVGLGTPYEDIASIVAVNEVQVAHKMLVCLGFGVDHYHGVCHAHFLEAVAELTKNGGNLGLFSLMQEMPEVQKYRAATEAVFEAMPDHISIVSSSILSALEGQYGDYHTTSRTHGSQLWINPLMTIYWCFQLSHVAHRVLYREAMKDTIKMVDIMRVVQNFREHWEPIRQWEGIPV